MYVFILTVHPNPHPCQLNEFTMVNYFVFVGVIGLVKWLDVSQSWNPKTLCLGFCTWALQKKLVSASKSGLHCGQKQLQKLPGFSCLMEYLWYMEHVSGSWPTWCFLSQYSWFFSPIRFSKSRLAVSTINDYKSIFVGTFKYNYACWHIYIYLCLLTYSDIFVLGDMFRHIYVYWHVQALNLPLVCFRSWKGNEAIRTV